MKKTGFTLIELLAVILILGIIALIAIPVVNKIVYEARKASFKQSVIGVSSAVSNDCNTKNLKGGWNTSYLTIDDGNFPSSYKIGISGKLPDEASIYINSQCNTALVAKNGNFCAIKNYDDDEPTVTDYDKDTCVLDEDSMITDSSCFTFDEASNTITGYNFANANCSPNVTIPEKINNVPVYYIAANSFSGTNQTKKLKTINFSKATELKEILSSASPDEGAFANNDITGISFGNLKNLTAIGSFAFNNNQLPELSLPEGLKAIYSTAFGYNYLKSVNFPSSLESIGSWTFRDNLIASVTIPESVKTLESGAFYNNDIVSANIPNDITEVPSHLFSGNQLKSITLPSGTTSIGSYAFLNNSIDSINIPSTVTSIGDSAFENNFLNAINLPSGLTSIGSWTFKNDNLTSINLSNTISYVGLGAFFNNKLTSVTIPTGITQLSGWIFDSNSIGNVIIPNNIVEIGTYAFSANKVKTLSIGNGVTTIDSLAFTDNNLQTVNIPSNVTTIASDAFNNSHNYIIFNINKASNSILNSPWGAGYSEVNWLG